MFGIDISNHQAKIALAAGQFDFAIIKATEGKNFIDPSFKKFAVQLTEMGKPIGVYCYARPDNQSLVHEMQKSAEFFVNTVDKAGLIGKAILVLDWEQPPVDRLDLMEAWLSRVKYLTGVTPFIYASSAFLKLHYNHIMKMGNPLWAASWPGIEQYKEYPNMDFIRKYNPKSIYWEIWQFTSNGVWPGYKGRVDFDYCHLSIEQWKLAAIGSRENIPDDFQWAIDTGLFQGYPDGSYRPDGPLTRAQLATVLRRYDKIQNGEVLK